ncbi:MAG: 30S ribosomal protein S20 [Gammaproteobacteria bacterium]|nr:30S ribosomal protein S20 [Gammaproteobacteria bacterium]
MANSPQARKRARQAQTRRPRNFSLRSKTRTYIKAVLQAIENNDKPAAEKAYKDAARVLDRVVTKGVLHKNTAARHKSRLSARVRTLG